MEGSSWRWMMEDGWTMDGWWMDGWWMDDGWTSLRIWVGRLGTKTRDKTGWLPQKVQPRFKDIHLYNWSMLYAGLPLPVNDFTQGTRALFLFLFLSFPSLPGPALLFSIAILVDDKVRKITAMSLNFWTFQGSQHQLSSTVLKVVGGLLIGGRIGKGKPCCKNVQYQQRNGWSLVCFNLLGHSEGHRCKTKRLPVCLMHC